MAWQWRLLGCLFYVFTPISCVRPGSRAKEAPADSAPLSFRSRLGPSKRGVGYSRNAAQKFPFPGMQNALNDFAASKGSWAYNWRTSADQTPGPTYQVPDGITFVPMIWGAAYVDEKNLALAKAAGLDVPLLGFNEPDAQSFLAPKAAADLWPALQTTGQRLGSPATIGYPADPNSWQRQFMTYASKRNLRVDFICLHWYGGGTDADGMAHSLKDYLDGVWEAFHKPMWVTEWALVNWDSHAQQATAEQQGNFITKAMAMMDADPRVERYAWYELSDSSGSYPLYNPGDGSEAPPGKAYGSDATDLTSNAKPADVPGSPSGAAPQGPASQAGGQ